MRLLVKQLNISVRDTLNYQNNCRNTFGWLVGLSYEVAKLLFHLCVDGRFSKIQSQLLPKQIANATKMCKIHIFNIKQNSKSVVN